MLLAWVLIDARIANDVTSPRLSSMAMEPSVARADPRCASLALPAAPLLAAIVKNTGHTYAVIEDDAAEGDDAA
ncbi:hypothetical protein Lsed01_00558 [Demequina sediminis]|uniref:Uncharacterized protein n=1 Tax=Demequina sediminis TaxID=1930058 RepID=A0ABP9WE68_9MICO|nr:hypothetical protein GCM10025873_17080 [Demequina sediminis]